MNRLFVVKKPKFISSNNFLGRIKRKYGVKKAGFSGTLDPFANGNLIVAFGQYTKLFRFLKKTPKKYRATIWLGTKSASYDIENVLSVKKIDKINFKEFANEFSKLRDEIEYTPPMFSAKNINGVRAYKLARENRPVDMRMEKMTIYESKILHYRHPFITFEVTLSEGGYVRSFAEILSKKLNVDMTLSYLERISEGKFIYENERALNPIEYLNLEKNIYLGDEEEVHLGKKLDIKNFKIENNGIYILEFEKFFSIVELIDSKVKYILNRIEIC